MKTLIQPLFIAVVLGIATFSTTLANTNSGDRPARPATVSAFKSGVYKTAEGKLRISMDKEIGGTVLIRLTDNTGKVFLTEQIGKNKTAVRLSLDVSALPDGIYQVAITNGVATTSHALTLSTQEPNAPSRLIAVN